MQGMRGWCAALAAIGLSVVAYAAMAQDNRAQDNKTFVMKLATATLNDGQHEWMNRFAVAIERNTGGRIRAEVYPASQLGAIPRMIEGTQLGSIQAYLGPPEFFVGVDQRFEAATISTASVRCRDGSSGRVLRHVGERPTVTAGRTLVEDHLQDEDPDREDHERRQAIQNPDYDPPSDAPPPPGAAGTRRTRWAWSRPLSFPREHPARPA